MPAGENFIHPIDQGQFLIVEDGWLTPQVTRPKHQIGLDKGAHLRPQCRIERAILRDSQDHAVGSGDAISSNQPKSHFGQCFSKCGTGAAPIVPTLTNCPSPASSCSTDEYFTLKPDTDQPHAGHIFTALNGRNFITSPPT